MSTEAKVKQPIKITEVLEMLNQGTDREEIRTHFNLKKSEFSRLMANPKLKGKKVKTARQKDSFVVIDDTVEGEATTILIASQTAQSEPEVVATPSSTATETGAEASDEAAY